MTEKMLDNETICAAVAGEAWALEKVLEHFSAEIDQSATVQIRLPDGSVRKEIDEDMRQSIVLALLEAIPNFPLEEPEER